VAGIVGAEGLSPAELRAELEAGGRLVQFDYAFSLCVITLAHTSAVHLIRKGEGTFFKSLPYNLLSLCLGWWAFPFGPFFTLGALFLNLKGGHDVTRRVLAPRERQGEPPGPGGGPRLTPWQRFKRGSS
jgi:hypothetical protein